MTENQDIMNTNHAGSSEGVPHRRRPHYSGRYPKKFSEKYKEQNPEKYRDQVEHVIAKGNTPAGMHIPIMVDEILDVLKIAPGMTGLDCTLGYGGHTTQMLKKLSGEGHLYGLDADPIEIVKTTDRLRSEGFGEKLFTSIHTNFRNIDEVAREHGPFNFVLADLGVSSMQIDNPKRGFSWREDGPLDLRFDPTRGSSAAERLREISSDEFCDMMIENSDEPYAGEIARAVEKHFRSAGTIETTVELRDIITEALLKDRDIAKMPRREQTEVQHKSFARVFQALRIDVNSEFEALYEFLEKLPDALAPGGRVAILTFHSGEDRLVKKMMKEQHREGLYSEISRDVTRPSKEECCRNPRAHSTKLRWAVK